MADGFVRGESMRSGDRWLFAAILLLAFVLRVYRLDIQSLWYDEAVTAQVAAQGVAELTRWTADDIQPPLYYYLVAGWTRLAGRGEWALRFPSVFFGTLTIALLWALARRLFGRGTRGRLSSLAAAALAGLSPLYVYYAQEARMYTLLTFLAGLAGYALLRAAAVNNANGEWRMANGRWRMADGRWRMADGRWRMADGRWRMADGRWQMANGRWQMADGESPCHRVTLSPCHLVILSNVPRDDKVGQIV